MDIITDHDFVINNDFPKLIETIENDRTNYMLRIGKIGDFIPAYLYRNADGTFCIEYGTNNIPQTNLILNNDLYLKNEFSDLIVKSINIISIHVECHYEKDLKVVLVIEAFISKTDQNLWDNSEQIAFCSINDNGFSHQLIGVLFDSVQSNNLNQLFSNCIYLNIDKYVFLLSFIKMKTKRNYLVLKTQTNINHNSFLKVLESIRTAIGFLSGLYIADNVWYFINHSNNSKTFALKYECLNKSLNNEHPIIDSNRYKNCPDEAHILNAKQFNNLVSLLYSNQEIERATFILIQAGALNNVSKGCLASVALETIKEEIIKTESENTIKDNNTQLIIKELLATLQKHKDSIKKDLYDSMVGKIAQIGHISNTKALKQPFISLDININQEEIHCIDSRNDFLHGRLVKPHKEKIYKNMSYAELENTISNKLIMITAMLILKKSGYNGKIIDWGYTELIKKRKMYDKMSNCNDGVCFRDLIV